MEIDLAALPDDVPALHRLIGALAAARQAERAEAEIERLRQQLAALQRARFGRRSERLPDEHLQLGMEDLGADLARAEAPLQKAPSRTARDAGAPEGRGSLPHHLARVDQVLGIGAEICPGCGGALHPIGETTSEMLDHVPSELRVLRIHRPRYGCRACGAIHQAPAPERPITKGLATPGLLAHVLVSKYADHLPLYRQSRIFARQGVSRGRSTLASWVGGAAWWLEPVRVRIAEHVRAAQRVHADDTVLPVLDPGRGRTRTGRLWVYARDDRPWGGEAPPAVVYLYSPDRRAERPAQHLARFRGLLQVDGYAGFGALAVRGDILLAACWAHVRRKLYDFYQATGSPIAAEALARIAALYAIEEEIRGASPEVRQQAREQWSRPVVETLKPWLEGELNRLAPKSGLAEAIRYTLARWPALGRFLGDGRVDLDTNTVERAIRPVTLGRKNHLFAGSAGGADRWACVATLITTAKLNNIEPQAWLTDVLTRLTDAHPMHRLDELLPWNWRPTSR